MLRTFSVELSLSILIVLNITTKWHCKDEYTSYWNWRLSTFDYKCFCTWLGRPTWNITSFQLVT